MTRPIATPTHAPARTRRRQRPFTLLRSALVAALVVTCLFALPAVIGALRSSGPLVPGPGRVEGQVALSGLESGACMSFAPALGQSSKTVFIDPGHGGLDPGVVGESGGQTVLEKDAALAVGMRLAAMLQGDGYRVVLSRTKDTSVASLALADSVSGSLTASAEHRDLITRAACANAANASALLSIHFDAFDDPSVGGTETFYDGARSFAGDNKRLAFDVQRALVSALGTNDRGIWTDDQLVAPTLTSLGSTYGHLIELGPAEPGYVDDPSKMPGALVEPLFLTNEGEARLASSEPGQQRIASALKDGMEKYLAGS
jgi:N-acetylmuramoyl-L-alanine amidase